MWAFCLPKARKYIKFPPIANTYTNKHMLLKKQDELGLLREACFAFDGRKSESLSHL